MNNYNILLNFALSKRIKNKTFIILNCIVGIVVALLFFVDTYIEKLMPDLFEKPIIYVSDTSLYTFMNDYLKDNFEIEIWNQNTNVIDSNNKYLIDINEEFDITIYEDTNELELSIIQNTLLQYVQLMNYSTLLSEGRLVDKEIVVHRLVEIENSKGENWGFVVVTAIYFFAMSFASIVANDVVYEKATRMMELILTSTTATVHLFAKLSAGWLVLLIQLGLIVFDILCCFIARILYDRFEGLFILFKKLGYIDSGYQFSVSRLIELIKDNYETVLYIVVALIIMFLGILLIQAVLVILSSYISNIEEAGNIQSPFYLLFLAAYYLTIFLDNAQSMSQGLGRTLSILPFFSMLFMPCRIFNYNVGWGEITYSIINALLGLVVVLIFGSNLYKKGVLDYSNTSLINKLHN